MLEYPFPPRKFLLAVLALCQLAIVQFVVAGIASSNQVAPAQQYWACMTRHDLACPAPLGVLSYPRIAQVMHVGRLGFMAHFALVASALEYTLALALPRIAL